MWYIYLVRCPRGYYCGIARNALKRFRQHLKPSQQAKAVRLLGGAMEMRVIGTAEDRSQAQSEEYRVKKLSRTEKKLLWDSSNEHYLREDHEHL